MAISERAKALRERLSAAVTLRRTWEAAREEWHELLLLEDDEALCEMWPRWAQELQQERREVQRQLAQAQLRNWALLRQVPLPQNQWRLLRWRYVEGQTWSQIEGRSGRSRQALNRLHNKALERLAEALVHPAQGDKEAAA